MSSVLSIQSHVSFGYVGNSAAVPTFAVCGVPVIPVHTTLLSNHPLYKSGCRGEKVSGEAVRTVLQHIAAQGNGFAETIGTVLSGYTSTVEGVAAIGECVRTLRAAGPRLFVCDPVMGDHGALYIPADAAAAVRDLLVPLADVVTPNYFEAEFTTGIAVTDTATAVQAAAAFHRRGPKYVIITSYPGTEAGKGRMLVSCADADGATQRCHVLEFALVPDRFVGTGDTFAALLTSRVRAAPLSDTALVAAARWSIAVLLGLLRDTAAHAPRVEGWQELRMCNLAAHVGAADLDLVTVGNEEVHVVASSV